MNIYILIIGFVLVVLFVIKEIKIEDIIFKNNIKELKKKYIHNDIRDAGKNHNWRK